MTLEELNAVIKFVSCKIAYEIANHENVQHYYGESTPTPERKELEKARRELLQMARID